VRQSIVFTIIACQASPLHPHYRLPAESIQTSFVARDSGVNPLRTTSDLAVEGDVMGQVMVALGSMFSLSVAPTATVWLLVGVGVIGLAIISRRLFGKNISGSPANSVVKSSK
jgi:hypothetical protein